MANIYAQISDLTTLYDLRQVNQLSTDDDTSNGNTTNQQAALDVAASKMDGLLAGRVTVPSPVPAMLTAKVCLRAFCALYKRRSDLPKELKDDLADLDQWEEDFIAGRVSIPNTSRQGISLTQSDSYKRGSITNNVPFFPNDPNNPNGTPGFGQ